jgi:hypothetical protein
MQLPIDKTAFIEALDRLGKIRNDVVHFDPNPMSRIDLESQGLSSNFQDISSNCKRISSKNRGECFRG